jgi:hypothetical protein
MQTQRQKKKCINLMKAHHAMGRRRFPRRQLNDQSRSTSCGLRIPRLDDDCRSSSSCFYLLFLKNLQDSVYSQLHFLCSTTSFFRDLAHFSSHYRARNHRKQWTDDNVNWMKKLKASRSSQVKSTGRKEVHRLFQSASLKGKVGRCVRCHWYTCILYDGWGSFIPVEIRRK